MSKLKLSGVIALVLAGLVAWSPTARADVMTLVDGNSSIQVNPGSQDGMFSWTVNGVNHLAKQWIWFRIGHTAEASIDTLTLISAETPDPNRARLTYELPGVFTIDVSYSLTGATQFSRTSTLAEEIRITNNTGSSIDPRIFQFTDFNLNGTAENDTAFGVNANTLRQIDPGSDPTSAVTAEVVATPNPAPAEVALGPRLLDALNDDVFTRLFNRPGPVTGDANFAQQWNLHLVGGGSFLITKIKQIQVSEPTSLVLLGSGLIGLAWYSRRLRRPSRPGATPVRLTSSSE